VGHLIKNRKIWIDLDNSPHVPFFRPIIAELEKKGYCTLVTIRRAFQVRELADKYNLHYKCVGRHHGKNKIIKLLGLFFRATQLMPTVIKERPKLALSLGSRAQMIVTKILRIPSVFIFDYEYAKHFSFTAPRWTMGPELVPDADIEYKNTQVIRYPGIKEDVYVPYFTPDPVIVNEIGLDKTKLLITMRPPATEAHYHNPQSEDLFNAAVDFFGQKGNICMVLLPRNDKQKASSKKRWPEWSANGKIIIPDHVVDGLNLMWHSDLVISGGGTMNREAAALGVPVYSIFRGKIGAIDRYLADKGKLILLESVEDIKTKVNLTKRVLKGNLERRNNVTLTSIVNSIVAILENWFLNPTSSDSSINVISSET